LLKLELGISEKKTATLEQELAILFGSEQNYKQLYHESKLRCDELDIEKERLDRKCVSLQEQVIYLRDIEKENTALTKQLKC
jgi:hypothetical protein